MKEAAASQRPLSFVINNVIRAYAINPTVSPDQLRLRGLDLLKPNSRMYIVDVVNYKGGIGKNTIAMNLAAAYAREGLRTLLIDTDPAASITARLGLGDGYKWAALSPYSRATTVS